MTTGAQPARLYTASSPGNDKAPGGKEQVSGGSRLPQWPLPTPGPNSKTCHMLNTYSVPVCSGLGNMSPWPCHVGIILSIQRLRLRDLKKLAQGHTPELRLEPNLRDTIHKDGWTGEPKH